VFTVIVGGPDGERARLTFSEPEITIGRGDGNHVVLAEKNVSKRHARIVVKDGRYILVDLKSTNGTYVNGRRITSPMVIEESDKIYIGEFVLYHQVHATARPARQLPPYPPRDRREAELLRQIAAREPASREIYADWLEEHGHGREAEFVRVQDAMTGLAPEDPAFAARSERLGELAKAVDYRWRLRVARPAIENCTRAAVPRFDFKCPKEWGALEPTAKQGVRMCGACKQEVFYCASVPEARDHAAKGECVALDLRAKRWPADLASPFANPCPSCGSDLGSWRGSDCPKCGEMIRMMVVGRMA